MAQYKSESKCLSTALLFIYETVTTHLKKTIVIALTTILILTFIVLSTGGGHGFFWPAKIVYPYSMIISVLNNQIGILAIVIAVVQIPIYGILMAKKNKMDNLYIRNSYRFSNCLSEFTN